mmetsp:Transcript_9751/g.15268  ORF Transcript_9751/g.15268 Transcript_9751/m.15268 type:complete len:93 (-) Transcript_9751:95-373(-)
MNGSAVEKQKNSVQIKLMESTQKRLFEKKDDSDDEEHNVFSAVHDKGQESAFAEAAPEEAEPEPVAKPGAVVFKSGGGKARNRSFRKKGGDD